MGQEHNSRAPSAMPLERNILPSYELSERSHLHPFVASMIFHMAKELSNYLIGVDYCYSRKQQLIYGQAGKKPSLYPHVPAKIARLLQSLRTHLATSVGRYVGKHFFRTPLCRQKAVTSPLQCFWNISLITRAKNPPYELKTTLHRREAGTRKSIASEIPCVARESRTYLMSLEWLRAWKECMIRAPDRQNR